MNHNYLLRFTKTKSSISFSSEKLCTAYLLLFMVLLHRRFLYTMAQEDLCQEYLDHHYYYLYIKACKMTGMFSNCSFTCRLCGPESRTVSNRNLLLREFYLIFRFQMEQLVKLRMSALNSTSSGLSYSAATINFCVYTERRKHWWVNNYWFFILNHSHKELYKLG